MTAPSTPTFTGTDLKLPFRSVGMVVGSMSLLVLLLWQFPRFWYTHSDTNLGSHWLTEQPVIPGWQFEDVPIAAAAEKVLVADRLFSGSFQRNNESIVRVFSAKRYTESSNEIGLFVHTPDRCWTESGWRMEATQPEFKELTVHGVSLLFERRIFHYGGNRELVYFGGLVGGQPLPYRLDHNMSVGMKRAMRGAGDNNGALLRAGDQRLWARVLDSFTARRQLIGPKQFVRISTPIRGDAIAVADELLASFLPQWLQASDYREEIEDWKLAQRETANVRKR